MMEKGKVALIQPIVEVGKALRVQKSPTGIQFLSAQLKREGYKVKMFHTPFEESLYEDVVRFQPKYVGISTMSVDFPAGMQIAGELKKRMGNATIILGGWHASGCAVSYLRGYESWSLKEILNPSSPFDFIVVGEGDIVLPKLLEILDETPVESRWELLKSLKGVGYLPPDGEIIVSMAERVMVLDSLADPDWDELDIDLYRDGRTGELDLSIHVQRGCRFRCTYCETPDVYPGKTARFSVNRVVDYLEFLIERFNPQVITITDEDFMANLEWIEELCREIIRRKLNRVKIDSFASVNDILRASHRETMRLMKEAGFNSYFVGIESLNEETLRTYNRPIGRTWGIAEYMKRIQDAVDISIQNDLEFLGDYMIGGLIESEEQIRRGFNRLKSLRRMPYVYLPILTPLPGTPLWKVAVENDMLIRDEEGKIPWHLYDCSHQVTKLPYKLESLREELEQEYFTSPNYIEDIKWFISRRPELLHDKGIPYIPLFKRLKRDYPENQKITHILNQLMNWRKSHA